jgi:GxxExxY protein
MHINDLSGKIVGAAIEAHRALGGPGVLESIYEEALCRELQSQGLLLERQAPVAVRYKGHQLASPLRIDILVERTVIVEVKSVVEYNAVFEAQALTYLRLSGLHLALVINFGEQLVKNGVHRVVHELDATAQVSG